MATVTVEEDIASRAYSTNRDETTFETKFNVFGTTDPFVAINRPEIPLPNQVLVLDGVTRALWVTNVSIAQEPGADLVRVTVQYGPKAQNNPPEPEENKATWTMSTAAQNVRIKVALNQETKGVDQAAIDFVGDQIGKTKDGVEGVDVLRPHVTLQIKHWLPVEAATPRYFNRIQRIAARVNSKTFSGPWGDWKAGEALYEGAQVGALNEELYEITHNFTRSFSIEDVVVKLCNGQNAEFPEKKGWDYFWVREDNSVDPNNKKKLCPNAVLSASIAEVYKRNDFDGLLLPNDFVGGGV